MSFPKDPKKAEEARKKMSEAKKGKYIGEKNPNFGKHHTEEARRKISEAAKGRKRSPHSEETRKKIGEANKGKKQAPHTEEQRRKISESGKKNWSDPEFRKKVIEARKAGGKMGHPITEETRKKLREINTGKKVPESIRRKMSESHQGWKPSEEWILKHRGENNPRWQGGVSFEPYCPKFNKEFKERIRAFFNNKCVKCGAPETNEKLCVHHVTSNKMTCCDNTIPLFVPLCRSCHAEMINDHGEWRLYFTDMIEKYYQGKCYLTKEEMKIYRSGLKN
jgi:hypothetical protein